MVFLLLIETKTPIRLKNLASHKIFFLGAKKSIGLARSSIVVSREKHCCLRNISKTLSGAEGRGISVFIILGQKVLTVIFHGPNSRAIDLVIPIIANLEVM